MTFRRDHLPDPVDYFEGLGCQLRGPGKWKTTSCQFHGGSDSMRVNAETGGWVCMACGAKGGDILSHHMQRTGDEFVEAAKALGCWEDDGTKPARRQRPLSFSPRAALEVLRLDALLCAVAGCNIAQGVPLTEKDREDLVHAAARIQLVAEEIAS